MTDRELMQQALEALQYASEETKPENLHGCDCLICKTINALRDRLAQPEKKEEWQYVSKLNAFSYPSLGLMGGDEFVSKDSIKRNVT
jgi:hypothetical protein